MRCNRFLHTSSDPYIQFSFQKSLRKYNLSPKKRIKFNPPQLTQTHTHRHNNNKHNCISSIIVPPFQVQTPSREEQNEMQNMQKIKINELNQQLIINIAKQSKQIISNQSNQEIQILNDQIKNKQFENINIQEIENNIQAQEQKRQVINQFNSQHSKSQLQYKYNQSKQLIQQIQNTKNYHLSPNQQEINHGGRINLTQDIRLSKRYIQKLIANGQTYEQLTSTILKKRTYLQQKRHQIQNIIKNIVPS